MKKLWNRLLDWIVDFDLRLDPETIGWKWYYSYGVLSSDWISRLEIQLEEPNENDVS